MSRQAYTSTVVAPVQVGLAILTVGILIVLAVLGPLAWPIAVIAAMVVVATGLYLSTVRLIIGVDRVLIGYGVWGRARTIAASDVLACRSTTLGWAQVFGIGVSLHLRTARLTVRPGPTLCLTLRDGEYIRISTPDPDAAQQILAIPQSANDATSGRGPRSGRQKRDAHDHQ